MFLLTDLLPSHPNHSSLTGARVRTAIFKTLKKLNGIASLRLHQIRKKKMLVVFQLSFRRDRGFLHNKVRK